MSNRRKLQSPRRLAPAARSWVEAPDLLAHVIAPLHEGVPVCDHVIDPLTAGGTEAAWAPIVTLKLVCLDCLGDFNEMFAALLKAGHQLHRCDGCAEPTTRLIRFAGRLPAINTNVYGYACLRCSAAAGPTTSTREAP